MLASSDLPVCSNDIVSTNTSVQTDTCSKESIKIIIFPPKNKHFLYNEETNSIQVQSIASTEETPNIKEFSNCSNSKENIYNVNDFQNPINECQTSLTPLIENVNINVENNTEPLDLIESKISSCDVEEIFKIEKTFDSSKLGKNCFLKGCKWSPDGLCLLSNSEDNILRLFDISSNKINKNDNLDPVLKVKEGGTIYDYTWYPLMNSSEPISCVFASASKDSPIHLWDAYSGELRATYQPINQCDEVTSAYSLSFSPDGSKLYSGFKKCLRIFQISHPGRISEERNLKNLGSPVFQSNIISCICINPVMHNLYVLGSYDKTIGIYTEPKGDLLCILRGHSGGITQVMFSADGNYLFSGGRRDPEILCWDIRNPGKVVFSIERQVDTQQKIQFDISPNQSYLITGTTNCYLKVYNIKNPKCENENGLIPLKSWKGHLDCINGVHFNPEFSFFATASGQRHILRTLWKDEEEEDISDEGIIVENSIKIWTSKELFSDLK